MPKSFLKKSLAGFDPYTPGQQPPDGRGWVKLNTNESPWPPSGAVVAAVREAVGESLRLYPSPTAAAARAAIASHHGLEPAQVAMGNGGDELIELAFRAFAGAGDRVAFPTPSYPLLRPLCAIHECLPAPHALGPGWGLPAAFATDPAPLKFLVNPNSPTGTWYPAAEVRRVVEGSAGVVVLDEAYADFAPEQRLDLLREGHPNLLLLRTFSKSYSLAGLRLGYALGPPDLIAALDLVKDSYNLNRLAIVGAVAAITDQAYHRRLIRFVRAERAWLHGRLLEMGFEAPESAANFLFARPPSPHSAAQLMKHLKRRRVLVRHYESEPVAGWFRITVGVRGQHESLLAALREAMA